MQIRFPLVWRSRLLVILATAILIITTVVMNVTSQPTSAAIAPLPDPYLTSGRLAEGEKDFINYLQSNDKDDKARFGLGVIQLMRGTQTLMQSLYKYGMNSEPLGSSLPFLRLPVPKNPKPQLLTYDGLQQVFQTWLDDLATVRNTIAPIQDQNVKLALRLGLIRLDFNGDGKVEDSEMLWRIFNAVTGANVTAKQAEQFLIGFDRGDALWLQGYTNVLAIMTEFLRAYDSRELFNACAHLFFKNVDTPHKFLLNPANSQEFGDMEILDAVAAIHLMKFPLAEPQRMTKILDHMREVVSLSRQSWQSILAEKDNDREWLPNPKQKSVIPNAIVTDDMVKTWLSSLDEMQLILDGKRTLPFWRDAKLSINFAKIFTNPTGFDLVAWIQGTAATPYLEKGKMTDVNIWNALEGAFGANLFNFVVWFN
ncbi:MAG: hypothetical protein NW214_06770 [Pseudanabaenaceae cyanobacterium bins.39]|nr:hypothetical protein [Pseudanabaenaceae cyanobacterium bins.39]